MSDLTIFRHDGADLRTVSVDGEPWFVASDVARILGYRDAHNLTRRLEEDDRGTRSVSTPSGEQQMTVISEAGLYAAILGSQVKGARAFKRWVTREVLPSIRRTGGYEIQRRLPQTFAEALRELADADEARTALEAQAAIDAPKVLFANAVAGSEDSILVSRLSTLLKQNGVDIGEVRLFQRLREDGFLCRSRGDDWNRPTQRAMDMGLFEVVERTVQHPDKAARIRMTPKVTGKGQAYFLGRYTTPKAAAS